MPVLVMKFGGTSVANLDRIRRAAKRVGVEVAKGYDVIVNVSAMSGKTNELVGWVNETSPLYDAREYDAVVSLSGLSAALLLMDAVQGRVDTRGALYRPGTRPDSEVPPAPSAPLLPVYPGTTPLQEAESQAIAQAVMAQTRDAWSEEDMGGEPEAEAFALNDREALVIIRTWCAAYNCDFAVYRVDRQPPYAEHDLQLDALPLGHEGLSGWVSYAPDTGELGYLYKGRGIADCGETGAWRFDGERFQLASFSYMGRCAGGNPGEWPELWRVAGP